MSEEEKYWDAPIPVSSSTTQPQNARLLSEAPRCSHCEAKVFALHLHSRDRQTSRGELTGGAHR
jgi:hypothetical protein